MSEYRDMNDEIKRLTADLAARDVIIGVKDVALKKISTDMSWKYCNRIAEEAISLSPNEVAEAVEGMRVALDDISRPGTGSNMAKLYEAIAKKALAIYDKALKGVVSK